MLYFVLLTTLFIDFIKLEDPLSPCGYGLFRSEDSICNDCSVYCNTSNNGKTVPESCIKPCNKFSTTQIVTILNNTGSSKTIKIIENSTIPIDNDTNSSKTKAILGLIPAVAIIVVVTLVAIYIYKKKHSNSSQRTRKSKLKKPNDSSDLKNINILPESGTVYQSAASDSLLSNSLNHNKIYQGTMNESIQLGGLSNNDNSSNDVESEKRSNSSQRIREGNLINTKDSSDFKDTDILPECGTVYQSAASESLLSLNHNKIYQDAMNESIQWGGLSNNDISSNDVESDSLFSKPSRQLTENQLRYLNGDKLQA